MSAPQRQQPAGVIERLLDNPHRFGFFEAVHALERWLAQREANTDAPRHGAAGMPITFRNSLSLSFPASEVAAMRVSTADGQSVNCTDHRNQWDDPRPRPDDIERIDLVPAFTGLLGAGGALPTVYTEQLSQHEQQTRDAAARVFLDVFTHRHVELFYQAWKKHRLALQYESDRRNRFLPLVLAVAGIGLPSLRDRLSVPCLDGSAQARVDDETLAYYSGLLQQRPVSAGRIGALMAEHFGVPVNVEQFVGRWFSVPSEATNALGVSHCGLDAGVLLGDRIWQRDLRIRLVFGPLTRAQYRRLLPHGTAAQAMRQLLTLVTGVSLEYEVRLCLRADAVQGMTLGDPDGGLMLGWDTFLMTRPCEADRQDAVYEIHAAA